MSCRGFCDCDKERMSHTSLLDARLLVETVQAAFLKKVKGGILMGFAVGKGCFGLCAGIKSQVLEIENKVAAELGFSHSLGFISALP